MKPLSVLLVSTSYPRDPTDWRARFIADMAESLSAREDIQLSVWAPPGLLPEQAHSFLSGTDVRMLDNMSQSGGIAHLLRETRVGAAKHVFRLMSGLRSCYRRSTHDILHINWVQNALPLPVTDHKPALITVLGSDYRWLTLPGVAMLLRRAIRNRKALISPNAEWMEPALERMFGDIAAIHTIPFGIEEKWYSIQRNKHAYVSGKWLTVSRVTSGKIGTLFDWGKAAFDENNSLHLIGPHQDEKLQIPDWVKYHGASSPGELQSKWFPDATGLISLSQHDEGRPQVMLEAMAAGLPIIASDLPAHRDIIRHGETGFLVSSSDELKNAIGYLSEPSNNRRMGDTAQKIAITHYGTWQDCAERYVSAYRTLME